MKNLICFSVLLAFVSLISASSATSQNMPVGVAKAHAESRSARPTAVPLPPLPAVAVNTANDEYMQLAERAGWPGAAEAKKIADAEAKRNRDQREFERYLTENKIKVYAEADVEKWMNGIVDSLNKSERGVRSGYMFSWEWFPLEGREQTMRFANVVSYTCVLLINGGCSIVTYVGSSSGGSSAAAATLAKPDAKSNEPARKPEMEYYTMPIPKDVLATVASIRDCYPDARFDVTRVSERKADPFMRVTYAGHSYVIAMWDEPGFERK